MSVPLYSMWPPFRYRFKNSAGPWSTRPGRGLNGYAPSGSVPLVRSHLVRSGALRVIARISRESPVIRLAGGNERRMGNRGAIGDASKRSATMPRKRSSSPRWPRITAVNPR